jgi:glycosyltransferase involved in cell wall biosynthesis
MVKRMNIIFTFVYLDQWYWNRYKDQLYALADNCDTLIILVNNGGLVEFDHDSIEIHYKNVINKNDKEDKLYRPRIKDMFLKYFGWNYIRKMPYIYNLSKWAMQHKGDIVLGYSGAGWNELYHNLIGREKDIPIIHRMRGYGRYERKLSSNIANRFFNDSLENMAYSLYDYHIPIKEPYREILIKRNINDNIISEPIGLGVNVDTFKSNSLDGEYIGYMGRLSREKNVFFLKKLFESTPNIKYLVIGDNPYNIKFPSNVNYIGKKQKHDIPNYIERCKALLLPSLSEGISNIILEAYSCSRIVLGSKYVFDSSLPVFGRKLELDIDVWKNAISKLDDMNLKPIYYDARKWAEKNSWDNWGLSMNKEIRKVLESE